MVAELGTMRRGPSKTWRDVLRIIILSARAASVGAEHPSGSKQAFDGHFLESSKLGDLLYHYIDLIALTDTDRRAHYKVIGTNLKQARAKV